jgi:hypothetical protein
MQTALTGIIALALLAIVYLLASGKLTGPQGPRGERGERGPAGPGGPQVTAAPAPSNKAEVLRKGPKGWEHHAWVRVDSAAWRKAYETPGLALRSAGAIDEGVQ